MKIIDFRVRPSTEEFVSIVDNRVFKDLLTYNRAVPYKRDVSPPEELVREMDEAGIELGVIQGRDLETTYGYKVSNDHVAEIVQRFPSKFIGFAGIDPRKGMDAVREVERAVKELGLKGVSMDPYMHQLSADHRKYYPVYTKCVELGIPVQLTCGLARYVPDAIMADASPQTIDVVARDFPELKIVVSHGGYPWVTEMIAVAMRNKNVYFEWSGHELHPGSELYVKAANTTLADKALFASAHPFNHFKMMVERYQEMPFSAEVREKVMYHNAAKLLELE